ncbi:hypothetical protein NMY22_g17173 [Coprinellus aureogranulatus]|nr:hypothetical protein NMY22_g17173 [Coprinellus aureogranulatus]
MTPPPSTPPKYSVYANPSSPGLKRRSEEDPHPESPSAKVRRVKERDLRYLSHHSQDASVFILYLSSLAWNTSTLPGSSHEQALARLKTGLVPEDDRAVQRESDVPLFELEPGGECVCAPGMLREKCLLSRPCVEYLFFKPLTPKRRQRMSHTWTVEPARSQGANANTRWQIHGPRFVSSFEGLLLEVGPDDGNVDVVYTRQFSGDKKQQCDSMTGRVAIACLHNGRYLSHSPAHQRVVTAPTPYYWDLVGEGTSRYSLRLPLDARRLTLPTPPGECTVNSPAQVEEATIKFILLEVTPGNREALLSGSIGPYAHPGAPAYHTFGSANEIRIYNHLDKTLYAAVSGQRSSSQYQIDPGSYNYWPRTSNERVHLTTGISDTGEQSVQVFEARTGMRLHVCSLGDAVSWRGVTSLAIEDAKYTANPEKPKHIGIKNDLEFDIYISIFSTVKNGNTRQYSLTPGSTDFWPRSCLETVFVSVGSAPGLPQAYVGRPGYILHINDWKPGVPMSDAYRRYTHFK